MAVVPSLEDLSVTIIRLNSRKIFSLQLDNLLITPLYYADKVLNSICEEDDGIFEDYLKYFKKERCLLQNVMINCSKIINYSTMEFLKGHYLTNLVLTHIENGYVRQYLEYVEPDDLTYLTLTKVNFYDKDILNDINSNLIITDADWIGKFYSITSLNISFSDLDDKYFLVICKKCKNLENLNISATDVTRIDFIENLKFLKYINCSVMSKKIKLNIPELDLLEMMVIVNNTHCDLEPILNRTFRKLKTFVLATINVVNSEKFM